MSLKTQQVTLGADACGNLISKSWTSWIGLDWIGLDWIGLDWIGLMKQIASLIEVDRGKHSVSVIDDEILDDLIMILSI